MLDNINIIWYLIRNKKIIAVLLTLTLSLIFGMIAYVEVHIENMIDISGIYIDS